MPGKNTAMNIRLLFINIQALHVEIGTCVDAAKAWEWGFLWECHSNYGFSPNFIK